MSAANRDSGPLEPVKRYLVKSIASGIGLASEGITSYKERKRLIKTTSLPEAAFSSHTPFSAPSWEDETTSTKEPATSPAYNDEEKDKGLWTQGNIQDELSPPPYTERAATPDGNTSSHPPEPIDMEKFLERYPAPEYDRVPIGAKLPQPVILPQKRPKTRSRGFTRAYAPSLGPCGISQDMFLDFIAAFDSSTQASPWLDAINLASIGLTFIPHFPMLVGIAIQVSIMAAKDVQSRTKTNSFLDKANAQIFMPRGLYCLIMTYHPEQDDESQDYRRLGTDVSSEIASKAGSTGLQRFQNRFRESSGHACEAELPESAPLIFPDQSNRDSSPEDLDGSKNTREKMKKAQQYITDYYDKRAQAKFAARYVDSGLVKGPAPRFTSRFADPNHPACSGSFRSLITGGYITPPDMGKSRSPGYKRDDDDDDDDGRRGEVCEKSPHGPRCGRHGDGYYSHGHGQGQGCHVHRQSYSNPPAAPAPYGGQLSNAPPQPPTTRPVNMARRDQDLFRFGGASIPTPGTVVKKAFKKNILYMMVVNMPSDEELALAATRLQQSRSKGIHMSQYMTHLRGR